MKGKSFLIGILILISSCKQIGKANSDDESNNNQLPEIKPSLFDSNYSYVVLSNLSENDNCERIQFNSKYEIEALINVVSNKISEGMCIPFIIDWEKNITTITPKAEQELGLTLDPKEITILEVTIQPIISDQNVLGYDFLNKTKIDINFKTEDLRMFVNGTKDYYINWPTSLSAKNYSGKK